MEYFAGVGGLTRKPTYYSCLGACAGTRRDDSKVFNTQYRFKAWSGLQSLGPTDYVVEFAFVYQVNFHVFGSPAPGLSPSKSMDPYSPDEDSSLTDEERQLIKQIENSQTSDDWGNMLGTGAGLAAGGIATALTGGAAAPLIPLVGGIGGQIGALIGGNIGAGQANSASNQLAEIQKKKNSRSLEQEARQRAFSSLLGKYSSF
jgi:hypothetical protein